LNRIALEPPRAWRSRDFAAFETWRYVIRLLESALLDTLEGLREALADRYIIDREIGHGGSATVYLAQDKKLGRTVAIKVLAPELSLAVRTERFLREIDIAARLQHPHILPLHDSGEANGLLYYVMPYVEGETLRDLLARAGRLPLAEAMRITREVGSALGYAHERKIVHRDIKPANILMSAGHAVVADFGIARAIAEAEEGGITESGVRVGTPAYMSPEQAYGLMADARSDLYSLGCVLFEMLNGQPPSAISAGPLARRSRDVPKGVHEILERVLSDNPHERFQTADEFLNALAAGEDQRRRRRQRTTVAIGTLAVLLVAGIGAWGFGRARLPALDRNKVVVFPLTVSARRGVPSSLGEDIATLIGSALEHTEPLKWIDGWTWLDSASRRDISDLSTRAARQISSARGARYYIGGSVLAVGESIRVVLRAHDVLGDSLLSQESSSGTSNASPLQLGLIAVTRLLPALLDPGRHIDLTFLSQRDPRAIALWIQGEHEYRRSRFQDALDFYTRAVEADSAFAIAALKGAQAASWQGQDSTALALAGVALAHRSTLPLKHQSLAVGLNAYLKGDADSAVGSLTRALYADPEWAEAQMALGEVFYHLIPNVAMPLDSMAEASFRRAVQSDTGFAPPLYHLTEIALRGGRPSEAAQWFDRFIRFDPDSTRIRRLRLMLECVNQPPGTVRWGELAQVAASDVLQAARSLAVGGYHARCAEEAFRSLLVIPDASTRWGAFEGLHGLLVSEGRYDELVRWTDSTAQAGMLGAPVCYFLDVFAGAPMEREAAAAESAIRKDTGDSLRGTKVQTRWLVAAWYAHHKDSLALARVRASLLADPSAPRWAVERAMAGHLALARGDTALARRELESLEISLPHGWLEWGLFEALPIERMTLAEIALNRGQFVEALRLAKLFDHPSPIAYLPFLAKSLGIRIAAARALHRPQEAEQYARRLKELNRTRAVAYMN